MYGTSSVTALPATGVGAAAVVASGNTSMAVVAILLLAAWTALSAGRALLRLTPREEA
jgi:hypothetical protein